MDWTALILGLAGILSTLIASGLGLYFTYKDRNSSYREELYRKQLDHIIECFKKINNIQTLINIHHETRSENAWEDFITENKKFSVLLDTSAAIMPTEIYSVICEFNSICNTYIDAHNNNNLASFNLLQIQAINMKFATVSRQYLGVDSLSEENLKLTKEGNFQKILEMSNSTWKRFVKELSKTTQNSI